ncbi:MAG: TRAP transporter substrate-binding protein [Bacteroidota bacterium]
MANMNRLHYFSTISLITLLLFSASCNKSNHNSSLKLAHSLNITHPVHKAMEFMSERVNELSEGQLAITIYPSGQLGSEQQNVELLQLGSLAMTKVSAAVMEGFSDDYKVLSLPYIFKSREHYFEVCDGEIGKDILLSTENKMLRGLCFYNAGSRSFYSNQKPILTPEDLEGSKIRVMNSQTAMQMVSALGGSPTPLAPGELYTALQSGVVDGAENNPPTFYTTRHYEICKYYSLDEHSSIPDVLLMSKIVWDKLSKEEQSWIIQAINESVLVQRKLWDEAENDALQKLEAAGVEISHPNKELFLNKLTELYSTYSDNKELAAYIQRIRELE